VAATLRPLLTLDALARLEAGAGWFLEHGVLEGAKARAIRKQVDALCLELRPQARGLVDAFAIPDEVLAAPIAI
jgi:acyl-CoA oxidase